MKKILLFSILNIASLLTFNILFAKNIDWQYKNNVLTIKQEIKSQPYFTNIGFKSPDQIIIKSGTLKSEVLSLSGICKLSFFNKKNELVLQSDQVMLLFNKDSKLITVIRLPNEVLWKGKLGQGIYPETDKKVLELISKIDSTEHFYGLGERLNGFDQKGKRVAMQLSDAWACSNNLAYKAIPFYMSSLNYGFLVNTAERVIFDMGKEVSDQAKIIMPGQKIEIVFFASISPLKVMEQFTDITGKSPIIPAWSLEPWLSRRGSAGWTNTGYSKQEMDQLEEHGYRFGVVLWEGIRKQISIDQKPSVFDLVNYWHNKGMKVVFWSKTGHISDSKANKLEYNYDRDPVKSYFIRDENNKLVHESSGKAINPDLGHFGGNIFIDPTNPKAMGWWFKNFYAKLILSDNGKSGPNGCNLDGIKIDFSELFPSSLKNYKTHVPTPGMANVHSVEFIEDVNNWLQKVKPDGGITWGRGGGLGIQRAGVFWNGDRTRSFAQLKGTLSSLLSVSVSGLAYAGHDLGGYMKGGDPEAAEVYIRGVQFAVFSPFMQDHGSAQAPREQNKYGRENYAFYTRVRYNIMPYLRGLITDAHNLGWPMMRPMFFYHPNDQKAWNIDDEYYLGKDLLIAPILTKGISRTVYLPDGNWVDFWTHEEFKGNEEIMITKKLNRIPVFVRKNAILPLALNEDLEVGGMFEHDSKNKLRISYSFFGLENGTTVLSTNTSEKTVLTISKTMGSVKLNFEGVNHDFALKIPNIIPSEITINGSKIVPNSHNFRNNKQGCMYDTQDSELKIKVEALKGISSYTIKLIGVSGNKVTLLKGKIVPEIVRPKTPKIVNFEFWDESVDIVFDKDDNLGERYVICYGYNADERRYLNFGNKITINGLQNNKRYSFRVWSESQLYRSLETSGFEGSPTGDKRPVNNYSGKGMFVQANHSTEKLVADDGTKTYSFDVKTKEPSAVKVWIQLNQHRTHNDYDKWYEKREKKLQINDSINIIVPAHYTLSRIFIAPYGRTPFFNDEF